MLDQDYQALKNVPLRFKQPTNDVNMFEKDYVMS